MAEEDEDQQTEGNEPEPSEPEPDPEPSAETSSGEDGRFTQEQLNSIVQDRVRREREKIEEELQSAGFESLEEAREAKQKLEERREQELKEKEQYKELLEKKEQEYQQELQEKEQRLQELERQRRNERLSKRVMTAAQEKGAVNPQQIARLVRDQVDIDDDGNVVAVNADGTPRLTDDGSKMPPEELVEDFLDDNPHFRKAASGRGAGGGPNDEPGGAPDADGFDPSKKDDPEHLLEHKDELLEKAREGEIDVF